MHDLYVRDNLIQLKSQRTLYNYEINLMYTYIYFYCLTLYSVYKSFYVQYTCDKVCICI